MHFPARFAGGDHHLVVDALEQHALDHALEHAHVGADDHDVLGADDHVHHLVFRKALVHAGELLAGHHHQFVLEHDAGEQIALADEVGHEGVLRLVVDALGVADLLDAAVVHHHDGIGHGEGFFLIVGDVEEGDAQFLLHALQFQLHLLTQLQIQRAQRLVQQKHLRLVDQRAGDGNALLLAAGKRLHGALFVALHLDEAQHAVHALSDLRLGQFAQLEAEGDVVKDVQVGERGRISERRCSPGGGRAARR